MANKKLHGRAMVTVSYLFVHHKGKDSQTTDDKVLPHRSVPGAGHVTQDPVPENKKCRLKLGKLVNLRKLGNLGKYGNLGNWRILGNL